MITFDQFKEVELRVARVLEADRVEGSDKLLRLSVSLGDENRQILAGIGKHYDPEQLVGRQIVIVANLEPRSMMGLESQGMVLAAGEDHPVFLSPAEEVGDGSRIR